MKVKSVLIKSFQLVAYFVIFFFSFSGLIVGLEIYDFISIELFGSCCDELYSISNIIMRSIFSLFVVVVTLYVTCILLVILAVYLFRLSCQDVIEVIYPDENLLARIRTHRELGMFWNLLNAPIEFVKKWYVRFGK